ncbi:hypothetical protein ciss_14810 [Carboxydothermus islandicus]|uniref:DUF3887 domain-containing protein n=2 Tax=Carboxydothermus islandicus TaxID=661089 RepID=A0A1L8D2Z3_9THEO|nr:hypothetical protein ciss_14810 [Carboxydothermus islandicus]
MEKIINNGFINKMSSEIKKLTNSYPTSEEELAKAFAKALKDNSILKVKKYLLGEDENYAKAVLNMGGGKTFKISKLKSDVNESYYLLENINDKNEKFAICIIKNEGKFVVVSISPYDPSAPETE